MALSIVLSSTLIGCANAPKNLDPKSTATTPPTAEVKSEELSPQEQMQKLREKITDLETRISALNEKINLENGAAPAKEIDRADPRESARPVARELPTVDVKPAPAAAKVVPTSKTPVKFVQDENIDRYREAKILFDSGRFTDATVEFVAFAKESPDHVLAPAAQYFVGLGYLKQKEYGRAEEEFNRGLVSYPHSNYVPDTLLSLLEISIAQKKAGRIAYYQQKISSTFPNSPQAMKAALLSNAPPTPDSVIEEKPKMIARPEIPEAPEAPAAPKVEGESQ